MEKKIFFTDKFYQDPELALNVLNELVGKKQVADQDMYQSGTFLFIEVYDNEITRNILSSVISDLEAYKAYNNENYVSDGITEIGLCALQEEHSRFFRDLKSDKEIKWNNEIDAFVFSEDMPLKFN